MVNNTLKLFVFTVNILSGSAAGLNFDKSKIILNELLNSYKVALDLNLAGKFNSLKEFKNLKVPIFEDISKDFEKLSFSTTATNKIDLEFDKKGNLLNTSVKGKADISNLELDLVQNAFSNILDEKNRKFKNGKLKAEFDKKSIFIDGIIFNQNDTLDFKINTDLAKKTSKINIISEVNFVNWQNRGAAAVYRGRHFWRYPTFSRHERFQDNSCYQQGSGSTHIQCG